MAGYFDPTYGPIDTGGLGPETKGKKRGALSRFLEAQTSGRTLEQVPEEIDSPDAPSLGTPPASTASLPSTRNYVEKEASKSLVPEMRPRNYPETLVGRPLDASPSPFDAPAKAKPASSPIRAYKDAQGRTVFSNIVPAEQPSLKEVSYEAETAKLRPEGRQAGGVSSPVARDDQGRTTLVADPEVAFNRQRELEDLGHAAIVQQLKDQADPQAPIRRELGAARMIAQQLVPAPADLEAYINANTAFLVKSNPGVDPKLIRAKVEQEAKGKMQQAQQRALEEHFNKLQYPGATLSGYGAQLRGDASNFGAQ